MLYEHESPEFACLGAQHAFATTLVQSLGYDDALQICRDNGWDGIFDIVLAFDNPGHGEELSESPGV